MLNNVKTQSGYSLISVLLLFTLMGIVGLVLTAYIMNSLTYVNVNKLSIEDKVDAENSIEIALAYLDKEIESLNKMYLNAETALPNLKTALEKVASFGESNGYTVEHRTVTTANSEVIIEEVSLKAPVGDSGKSLKKVLALTTISEVFQYSVVSPTSIELNGAPYIEGDIIIEGDLANRNEAKFVRSDEDYWVPTSYPAFKGDLTVLGNYHYFDNNHLVEFIPNAENLNNYFSMVPTLKDRDLVIERIKPKELVEGKKPKEKYGPISIFDPDYIGLHDYSFHRTINHSAKFPRLAVLNTGKLVINGDTQINGNLRIDAGGELIVKGDLYIGGNLKIHTAEEWRGKVRSGGKLTVEGSIKVMGEGHLGDTWVGDNDLTDDEMSHLDLSDYGSIALTSNNSYLYIDEKTWVKNFNFTGKMYVESHVEISGDFNSNGTVFVYRDALIQDFSNKAGTLVIIADEEIKISNNNQYEDTPKVMNAYIYSNAKVEIFGIGSHLEIRGGVHGNPLILNATKGRTETAPFSNSFSVKDLYFQNHQHTIDPIDSRLSIIFNKELIFNPPLGIPAVDRFSVKVLDTVYE